MERPAAQFTTPSLCGEYSREFSGPTTTASYVGARTTLWSRDRHNNSSQLQLTDVSQVSRIKDFFILHSAATAAAAAAHLSLLQ